MIGSPRLVDDALSRLVAGGRIDRRDACALGRAAVGDLGSDGPAGSASTRDGLRELRPGYAVWDGLEPLHRLSAEHESDVPCRDLIAPTGHRSGSDFRVVEEDP
jgi:hypothetical protein